MTDGTKGTRIRAAPHTRRDSDVTKNQCVTHVIMMLFTHKVNFISEIAMFSMMHVTARTFG